VCIRAAGAEATTKTTSRAPGRRGACAGPRAFDAARTAARAAGRPKTGRGATLADREQHANAHAHTHTHTHAAAALIYKPANSRRGAERETAQLPRRAYCLIYYKIIVQGARVLTLRFVEKYGVGTRTVFFRGGRRPIGFGPAASIRFRSTFSFYLSNRISLVHKTQAELETFKYTV